MRIGVVTTSYPRAPDDAAGNFVAAHVGWLLERGHEVDVMCAGDAERAHQMWQPGASITAVPAGAGLFYRGGAPDMLERGAGVLAAARFSARMTVAVAKSVRNWDAAFAHWLVPSAVSVSLLQYGVTVTRCQAHSRSVSMPTFTRCQAHSRSVRMPTLAIAHSGDVHFLRRLHMTAVCARLLRQSSTRIAFVSHTLREQFLGDVQSKPLRRWIQEHSLVSPMGIDVARFRALRRPAPPNRDHLLHVSFIGRLVPIKGVSILLEAVQRLQHLWPHPLELTIAGHGPCRAQLERQASALTAANIRFTGELTTRERDHLLARTDLLVLPSLPRAGGRTEGTPITALEAMAAGVPVIASRTGGLAELPENALALVPPGDPHALALAIQQNARFDTLQQRRVQIARDHAESLDWDSVGARLFAQVLVNPRCDSPFGCEPCPLHA